MNRKPLSLAITLAALIAIGGTFWLTQKKVSQNTPQGIVVVKDTKDAQKFVTDVDSDVSHWQTKETEFFSIKFPKEWYWIESDLKKTGYHSVIITNNQEFPINEYSDIGIGTGGNYPLTLRNDSEIVISTNNLGWVTTDAGSPLEFLEFEIDRVKKNVNSSAECGYVSALKDVPLIAKCSYIDANSSQRVITYYNSETKRTFAYSARVSKGSNLDLEPILELIIKSLIRKKDF